MLFKNGIDLHSATLDFVRSAENLVIYVPYVKANSLAELLDGVDHCRAIFVRWELKDLVSGASDLAVYGLCTSRKIPLFRNPRLHLKAYVDDNRRSLITTANISRRALSDASNTSFNFEIGTIVEGFSLEDRLYFAALEQQSTLITPGAYAEIVSKVDETEQYSLDKDDFVLQENHFLISSLPMSRIDELMQFYMSEGTEDEVVTSCAIHDLALYQIPLGLSEEDFRIQLREAFISHPFVQAFVAKLKDRGEIYFGEAKAWIQENCTNVPIPRRWEITEIIQILFEWFSTLSPDEFTVDRPNYSQRLSHTW